MWILNTTNLKDSLIDRIATLVRPTDTPVINSIELRSKKLNRLTGNWGKFYPLDYRITLCVPQDLQEYISKRTHTKNPCFLSDRYDFLATVIGHEYRHAWQFINSTQKIWLSDKWREVDAEEYEPVALKLWIDYKAQHNIVTEDTPESYTQSAARKMKWGDYKKLE